jgi:hypothetical protein
MQATENDSTKNPAQQEKSDDTPYKAVLEQTALLIAGARDPGDTNPSAST